MNREMRRKERAERELKQLKNDISLKVDTVELEINLVWDSLNRAFRDENDILEIYMKN